MVKYQINKNFSLFLVFSLFLFLFFYGCIESQQQNQQQQKQEAISKKEFVEQQLNLAGVQNAQIIAEGSEIIVSYNPTNLVQEGELLAQWGTIFGIMLENYPNAQYYSIEQQFNGEKILLISLPASALKNYINGKIDIYQLKKEFIIKTYS